MKGRGEYPRHWRLLAALVKCRAGWCCEHCGYPAGVGHGHVLTVHHLDGNKSNCAFDNLVALCQKCHLHIQGRFFPGQVVMDFARPAWMDRRGLGGVMKRSESPVQTQKVGEGPETMRIYLPGLAERVHLALERAGYDAVSLRQASQEDLEAVDGIGPATARKIRKVLDACTPV